MKTKTIIKALAFSICGLVLLFFLFSPHIDSSFCSKCALQRHTKEIRVSLTNWAVFRNNEYRESPMHEVLSESKLLEEHEHDWVPSRKSLRVVLINSESVCAFTRDVIRYRPEEEWRLWLGTIFTLRDMEAFDLQLSECGYPFDGEAGPERFRKAYAVMQEYRVEATKNLTVEPWSLVPAD